HVHRDADGARLVGDRARDGLADPPRGVSRELVATAVFELVDRLHQADVAFLDQVEELQAAVGVLLGDRDHQAQVGLDHLLLGASLNVMMCSATASRLVCVLGLLLPSLTSESQALSYSFCRSENFSAVRTGSGPVSTASSSSSPSAFSSSSSSSTTGGITGGG